MTDNSDNNKKVPETEGCGACCSEGGKKCASCDSRQGCGSCDSRGKLCSINWLDKISGCKDYEFIEVQFKNTRKGFYTNPSNLDLKIGDTVVVEAAPGHDVGTVSMVGALVALQMKKANLRAGFEAKKIFRKARPTDIERFEEAKSREHSTMIESRKIAEELGLDMKIGDVEYQGDGGKAIFYYIADERVDFRKLIRVLADAFKVRIEMKQIGARQEAGRIGGMGPCGRPLCCASWMTRFASVGTNSARIQDLSMNPQKLAGQCAKLKCCLNFEIDNYVEASSKLPHKEHVLQTKDADYYFFKADILTKMVTYSTAKGQPVNCVTVPASRAFEIIALNKRGIKVDSVSKDVKKGETKKDFVELVGQDSIARFDKSKKKKKKKGKGAGNDSEQPVTNEKRSVNKPNTQDKKNVGNQNRNKTKGGDGSDSAPKVKNDKE
jgi:cell fate regulator YaaT (PSP1 superfamily)